MARWELEGFNTDSRYRDDVRFRTYTTSAKRADAFARIPKIQFTDSGHGIVFTAREMKPGERKKELRSGCVDHVYKHWHAIMDADRQEARRATVERKRAALDRKRAAVEKLLREEADYRSAPALARAIEKIYHPSARADEAPF